MRGATVGQNLVSCSEASREAGLLGSHESQRGAELAQGPCREQVVQVQPQLPLVPHAAGQAAREDQHIQQWLHRTEAPQHVYMVMRCEAGSAGATTAGHGLLCCGTGCR